VPYSFKKVGSHRDDIRYRASRALPRADPGFVREAVLEGVPKRSVVEPIDRERHGPLDRPGLTQDPPTARFGVNHECRDAVLE
jgi:hypothetical protein